MSLAPPFLLLDRYEVTAEIGRGGHATVYRARDRVLARDVAVKLLRDDVMSPDLLARFRQEIQITAQLEHAHILHVYDTGTHEGRPYIVMELATGRTLAARLERERQLPIEEALQITRDVGLALAHAHARGIVHRDIKPENILLAPGGAILADFGIARLTTDSLTTKITSTGVAVGTVQYMSPEQLCAESDIDGRSDQYSLASVLYEMLAGVRPHISATIEGLRLLRLMGKQEPVSTHRPAVPAHVSAAVHRALCSMTADRFRSLEEFLAALGMGATGERAITRVEGNAWFSSSTGARGAAYATGAVAPRGYVRRLSRAAAGMAMALAVGAGVQWAWRNAPGTAADLPMAAGVSVVLPEWENRGADSASVSVLARSALKDELDQWPEVEVISRSARGDTAAVSFAAGAVRTNDSVRVSLDVSRPGSRPMRVDTTLPVGIRPPRDLVGAAMASLVRQALGGIAGKDAPGIDAVLDRSLVAVRSYADGFRAMRDGEMSAATKQFRAAASESPAFAQAALWAAQAGAWSGVRDGSTWKSDVETARRGGSLRGIDSLLAVGLHAMARMDFQKACSAYRTATEADVRASPVLAFTAWYGLAECTRLDSIVVQGRNGLQFRSSHWTALSHYRRAVELSPTAGWLAALFNPIMRITYAEGTHSRAGRRVADTAATYFALPSVQADTLAFVPVSRSDFSGSGSRAVPVTWSAALARGRSTALDITSLWVSRAAESASAWLRHAVALEMAGRISKRDGESSADAALDSVERRAPASELRARMKVARVRLALRRGDVADAVQLARLALDSASSFSASERSILAPLAALLGDAPLTTALSWPSRETSPDLPAPVADSLHAFSVAASLRQCSKLTERHHRLDTLFNSGVAKARTKELRQRWLLSAYRTAVSCLGPSTIEGFSVEGPIDLVYGLLARGHSAEARATLAALHSRRTGASTASISWDALYAESWALVQLGDTATARDQLVGALDNIAGMSFFTLDRIQQAAGLRHGLLLLRDVSPRTTREGSTGERLWAERAMLLTTTRTERE